MRIYELKQSFPFLVEGRRFVFDDDSGDVYAVLDGKVAEYPLRSGLAGYLWLLLTEGDKYMVMVGRTA